MLLPVLAGAVGIGTVGHLENAVTFSPLQLVIDNELVRYVRRAIRTPWVVDDETLATELIHAVGPGGNYLSEPHTAEHFRDELFFSPLFPVRPWAESQQKPDEFDQTRKAHRLAAGVVAQAGRAGLARRPDPRHRADCEARHAMIP